MTVPKFKKFKIEAYKPGKSKIGKVKNITKLSANESALGVSPKVKRVLNSKNLILSKKLNIMTPTQGVTIGVNPTNLRDPVKKCCVIFCIMRYAIFSLR